MKKLVSLCEAIARQEGWEIPSSRCRRNHNPGNIRSSRFATNHGQIGIDDEGFAVFASDAHGFIALSLLLEVSYVELTLRKALYKYAPPSDHNDTEAYIRSVSEMTGIDADEKLTPTMFALSGDESITTR
jgi:hypothetical protein